MVQERSEIIALTPTFLGLKNLGFLTSSIEDIVAVAVDCGYDGVQLATLREDFHLGISPLRITVPGFPQERQLARGELSAEARSGIRSARQSYRGETNWMQAIRHKERALALVSRVLFEYRPRSLEQLIRLQEDDLVGPVPVTLYPARDDEERALHQQLHNKQLQPSKELVDTAGIDSFEGLVDFFSNPKCPYKVSFNIAEYLLLEERFKLPPPERGVRTLLPFIDSAVVPGSREDIAPKNEESRQRMVDLKTGSSKSQSIRTLLVLRDLGYRGPVSPGFAPGLDPIDTHKRVVNNLKELLAT